MTSKEKLIEFVNNLTNKETEQIVAAMLKENIRNQGGVKMKRESISDAEVEIEIARLRSTEEVKLAEKEIRAKNRRRCYMAQLRYLEKRGKQLKEMGVTAENMETVLFGESFEG